MKKIVFLLVIILWFVCFSNAQTIRYVKTDGITPASDAINATSWETSCADLQALINVSAPNDTIWVAQGTYVPIRPADNLFIVDSNNRINAFFLKANIHIYGGFSGTETTFEERDWENNVTILSGDIGLPNDSSDNCCHVVLSVGDYTDGGTLDGFTITKGYANIREYMFVNAEYIFNSYGGGIYNYLSSPIFSNLIIRDNIAYDKTDLSGNGSNGGGVYNKESSPIFTNVHIVSNVACGSGGGMNNYHASPKLNHVYIYKNRSTSTGGGIYNSGSSPELTNVVISENTAIQYGGGMTNMYSASPILKNVIISNNFSLEWGGGMFNLFSSSPKLINVLISGNSAAESGGGIKNSSSSIEMTNVTIFGNSCSHNGGGIDNSQGIITINNSIIAGNNAGGYFNGNDIYSDYNATTSVTLNYSLLQDTLTYFYLTNIAIMGDGCLSGIDPLLTNTANNDYGLQPNSPCINSGNNNLYLSACNLSDFTGESDLTGEKRLVGASIDMGAFENQSIVNIKNYLIKPSLAVFPNPVENSLYIQTHSPIEQITIYDINGKQLKQIFNPAPFIEMSDLANGIYFIKIKTEGKEIIQKIIKQ